MLVFLFTGNRENQGKKVPTMKTKESKFSIGREKTCHVVLGDDSVSRYHAELILLANGNLLLIDCKSRNGTFVVKENRGKRIHQELINPSDTLQFGEVRLEAGQLLESINISLPPAAAKKTPTTPPKPWVQGKRLVRCPCGAVKNKDYPCQECGA